MSRPDTASPQPPIRGPGAYAGAPTRPPLDVLAGYARLYAASGRRMSARRAGALLAVGAAAALLLTGCGDDEPADAGPSAPPAPPVGEWADESARLPPLELGEQPLWTNESSPAFQTVAGVDFRGDTMIAVPPALDGSRLSVVDATNGTPKWTLDHLQDLPGGGGAAWWASSRVIGGDDDWFVLVEYIQDSCADPSGWCPPSEGGYTSEFGLAALSGADGSVLWKTPIVPAVPSDSAAAELDLGLHLAGSDDTTALVAVAPSEGVHGSQPVPVEQVHAVAANLADGSVQWDEPGQWPVAVAGDTVLAVDGPAMPGGDTVPTLTLVDESTVVGMDAATGERGWELADYEVSDVVMAVGDYAVLRAGNDVMPNNAHHLVVEASTGEEVGDLGVGAQWCSGDGGQFAACLLDVETDDGTTGPHLVSFDAATAEVVVSTVPAADGVTTISGVGGGYAFVGGYGADEQNVALDPTAENPTGPLPGMFVGSSDRYAVFATFTGDDSTPTGFAVYEVVG